MTEAISNFFLETVGRELCVFFCAMLPVIECRGSVPLGCSLGLPFWQNGLFSILGNLLPVPLILLFIQKLLHWMASCRVRFLNSFASWLFRKVEKHKSSIEKYSYLGLMLFVALPVPGTGAWTGSMIASILGLDWKKSFLFTTFGVLIATLIMSLISYGVKAIVV